MAYKDKKGRNPVKSGSHRSTRSHDLNSTKRQHDDENFSPKRESLQLQQAAQRKASMPSFTFTLASEHEHDAATANQQPKKVMPKANTLQSADTIPADQVPVKRKRGRPPKNKPNLDSQAMDRSSSSNSNASTTTASVGRADSAVLVFDPAPFHPAEHASSVAQTVLPTHIEHVDESKTAAKDESDQESDDDHHMVEQIWELSNPNPVDVDSNGVLVTLSDGEGISAAHDFLEIEELSDAGTLSPRRSSFATETAYQELLDWGTGGNVEGLTETVNFDGDRDWYEDAPQYEFADTSDEDGTQSEDDVSVASSEEAEQMLLVKGLCGSDSEGETTDTLDDEDHAGLARYGIEFDGESETSSPHQSPKAGPKTIISNGPILGSFATAAAQAVTLEETNQGLAMSPFSSVKRKRARQNLMLSSPLRRVRRQSTASSHSTATSMSIVSLPPSGSGDRPAPSDIPEEAEDTAMDLDLTDVLEVSALAGSFEIIIDDSDDASDADLSQLTDLRRWNRIGMGAFRRRAAGTSPTQATFLPALNKRGRLENGVYFLPVDTPQHSKGAPLRGVKRKITRQEAIGMSPMICPIKPVQRGTARSRKEKRADKKANRKRTRLDLTDELTSFRRGSVDSNSTSGEPSQSTTPNELDHEVPILELPAAQESLVGQLSISVSEPAHVLPVPSLPSAGCLPLNSPFMYPFGVSSSVSSFSLTAPVAWPA